MAWAVLAPLVQPAIHMIIGGVIVGAVPWVAQMFGDDDVPKSWDLRDNNPYDEDEKSLLDGEKNFLRLLEVNNWNYTLSSEKLEGYDIYDDGEWQRLGDFIHDKAQRWDMGKTKDGETGQFVTIEEMQYEWWLASQLEQISVTIKKGNDGGWWSQNFAKYKDLKYRDADSIYQLASASLKEGDFLFSDSSNAEELEADTSFVVRKENLQDALSGEDFPKGTWSMYSYDDQTQEWQSATYLEGVIEYSKVVIS